MGELIERINENNKLNGNSISDNYKANTMFFFERYKINTKEVLNIPLIKIQFGGFYFFQYQDDSNWMKYSPVFVADFKKFENQIIITAINFNFLPLEIRASLFDKFMIKEDFEKNRLLKVNHEGVYKALLEYGYEYALVEYNLAQVKLVHKIDVSLVPKFIYSGHPINKYDPKKLYEIWKKKLETRDARHQEMMNAVIADFYDISNEISENYNVLKGHVDRIQKSYEKYGK
jgi:hypothetical protein